MTTGPGTASTVSSRALTAALRELFPHADLHTARSDPGWTFTMPERSASELGVMSDPAAASERITRLAGMNLTVTGHREFRNRDSGRMIAVTVEKTQ